MHAARRATNRFPSLIQEAANMLTLIITAHPCGAVADEALLGGTHFKNAVRYPFRRPTLHEEVIKYHGLLDKFWGLAGQTPPIKMKSWAAKESDRNPNQPAVILYGVAMDHEKMAGLYRELLLENTILSKVARALLQNIRYNAKFLKREAKLEAAVICVLEPDTEHSNHYLTQFFSKYSPEDYLKKRGVSAREFQSQSRELLQSMESNSQQLMAQIRHDIEGLEGSKAHIIQEKMKLLPPWGAMTQGRLPAEDVVAAVEEIFYANGVKGPVTSDDLMAAIESPHSFNAAPLSPETRNICRFYDVYLELGGRMSEVVLANYESHEVVMCSHWLSLKLMQPGDKVTPAMPLAEDTKTLRNMADDLEALFSRPYFYNLALLQGVFLFIARSDTTRSAGIPSGNFEVLASAKETVERINRIFAWNKPVMDLILGQGSSPHRGLFFTLCQYFLPWYYPWLNMGVTIQPGTGQSRFATVEWAKKAILDLYAMNQRSEKQAIRKKQFDDEFITWMRRLEAPGEKKLQQVLTDSNSWFNEFVTQSSLTQKVLNRALGTRWKKQDAKKTAPFNETQRAITVFALTKEIGFPIHTVLPFVHSMRMFLLETPKGMIVLRQMYEGNINYFDHVQRIHQCLLDGDEGLIEGTDAPADVKQKMIGLFRESQGYLREITDGALPDLCPYKGKKEAALLLRREAKEEGVPRYQAYDWPRGTYA